MRPHTSTTSIPYPGLATQLASSLSLIASITIIAIAGFFSDTLRRSAMSTPWPIILIISISSLYTTGIIATTFLRCVTWSPILQFILHTPLAILWIIATALLGNELNAHLTRRCPPSDTFGHDMWMVCHMYKTVFSLTVFCVICSIYLVFVDVRSWMGSKNSKYKAMEKNTGLLNNNSSLGVGRNKKMGKGILNVPFMRKDPKGMKEEEQIMMTPRQQHDVHSDAETDGILRPDYVDPNSETRTEMPSPATARMNVAGYPNQFAGQDTRYDPGNKFY